MGRIWHFRISGFLSVSMIEIPFTLALLDFSFAPLYGKVVGGCELDIAIIVETPLQRKAR